MVTMELKKSFRKRLAHIQLKNKSDSSEASSQRSGLLTPNTPVDQNVHDFFSISFENTETGSSAPISSSRDRSRNNSISSTPIDDRSSLLSGFSTADNLTQHQASAPATQYSSRRPSKSVSLNASASTHASSIHSVVCRPESGVDDSVDEEADEIAEKILSVVTSRQVSNNWCLS